MKPKGRRRTTPEKFFKKVEPETKVRKGMKTSCLNYTGLLDKDGYGRIGYNYKLLRAHRYAWIIVNGEIPIHLVINHICENRRCVNHEHLELISPEENVSIGNAGIREKSRTHCPQGHKFTKENTIIEKFNERTKRKCRECSRIRCRIASGLRRKNKKMVAVC